MTETTPTYSVETEAIADPLLELKLKVAAIDGWENIHEWNPSHKPRKVFQGTNKKHPELGIFIPDYTSDLNAIVSVFVRRMGALGCHFQLDFMPSEYYSPPSKPFLAAGFGHHVYDESPAIALCKLLLELTPDPSDVKIIDDDGDVDEPTVIEATFG